MKFDVAFGLENHAVPHDEMHIKVDKALSEVDMLNKADYEPHSLSGGQKQRVDSWRISTKSICYYFR